MKNLTVRASGIAIAILLLTSAPVMGHVKWFVDHDVSKPPLPIGEVLTGTFVKMFLVAVAFTYLFFLADRYIHEKGYLVKLDESLKRFDGFATYVMRISAGIFFLSLWIWYLYHGSTFYITPELKTSDAWVPWMHLILALTVATRVTTPITGIGILVLFGAAIRDYGIFHMLDYVIFLGIAYFLITIGLKPASWLKSGFVALFACAGLTLIWASVEKFAYADWTIPLLEANPDMRAGLEPRTFMMVSGFAEFSITFA